MPNTKNEKAATSNEFKNQMQRFKIITPVRIVERAKKKTKILLNGSEDPEHSKMSEISSKNSKSIKEVNNNSKSIKEFNNNSKKTKGVSKNSKNTKEISKKFHNTTKSPQEDTQALNNIMKSLKKISSITETLYGKDGDIRLITDDDDIFRAVDEEPVKPQTPEPDTKPTRTVTPSSHASGSVPRLRTNMTEGIINFDRKPKKVPKKPEDYDTDDSVTEYEIGKLIPLDSYRLDEIKRRIDKLVDKNEAIAKKRKLRRRRQESSKESSVSLNQENEEIPPISKT